MIWVDCVIIGIITFSALISLVRGFIREILSLITWGCAFFIARHYYSYLSIYFTRFEEQMMQNAIAVALLFVTTLIVGAILNYVINSLIEQTGLSSTDRILGVFFGVLRGILIISVSLFFLDTFTSFSQNQNWKKSQFIPQFSEIIKWLFNYLQNTSSFL